MCGLKQALEKLHSEHMRPVLTLQIGFIERKFLPCIVGPCDDRVVVARLNHGLLSQVIIERWRDHEREHEEHAEQDQQSRLVLAKFFKHRSGFLGGERVCVGRMYP